MISSFLTSSIEPKTVPSFTPALVDFDAFENLTKEVREYRKQRLIDWATFTEYSKEKNSLILDTRSKAMYDKKHLKGAIHLNFSDFTQDNLATIIPSYTTRILIYCNNNIENDPVSFASKIVLPKEKNQTKSISLALNIPTFITLYGYGYQNIYELSELISATTPKVSFDGSTL